MRASAHGVIVTSIGPSRTAVQQRAIASWRKLGFRVLSLNTSRERALVGDAFPDVEFVDAPRDGSTFLGRPFVFVKDAVMAAAASGAALCGIVNADVELEAGSGVIGALTERTGSALVYGSRVDYNAGDRTAGEVYRLGYDYFFFDPGLADRIPDRPFCLGAPWWDYWLPAVCLQMGVRLERVTTRLAFHERHATAFSDETWMVYAAMMHEHLEALRRRPPVMTSARNAAYDIQKRTVRLAEAFLEHLEAAAMPIDLGHDISGQPGWTE